MRNGNSAALCMLKGNPVTRIYLYYHDDPKVSMRADVRFYPHAGIKLSTRPARDTITQEHQPRWEREVYCAKDLCQARILMWSSAGRHI